MFVKKYCVRIGLISMVIITYKDFCEVIYMANFLLWLSFIAPWFLLILLDMKRVKKFLSVAFFTLVLTSIYWQIAQVYGWWKIGSNLFFLTNISAFNYGFLPVTTILVFYFTYPKAWLFFGANIAMDAFQAFIVSPYLFERLGLYSLYKMNNLGLFLLLLSFLPIIYFYQRWYDRGQSK